MLGDCAFVWSRSHAELRAMGLSEEEIQAQMAASGAGGQACNVNTYEIDWIYTLWHGAVDIAKWIAPGLPQGFCEKIWRIICKYFIGICIGFCYVCSTCIHHNGGGLRPPPQWWAALPSAPPIIVESIMVDAGAADIAKTYANAYPILAYSSIRPIFSQDPCESSGAIHLAKSTAPLDLTCT